MTRVGSSGGRLDFLDGLRGIAVALVLLQHVGEVLVPGVRSFTSSTLPLGQLGVVVFFLCSGFIIPASLERGRRTPGRLPALRAFWTGRLFRLFPLYWLSLAAAAVLVSVGRHVPEQSLSPSDWLANAAMLQLPAGAPLALGLYWTLALEMVFYLLTSGLFLLGWHRRSPALSLAASAGCVGAAVLAGPLLDRPAPLSLFCLATMFLGSVFHRWHTGAVQLRTLVGCVGAALTGGAALLATSGGPGAVPMLTAWLGAYAVFGVGLALRRRAVPSWLRRLGVISYSVYLVQALVLLVAPVLATPLLTALLWTALVIGTSELTYRIVEQPAVALGRRLVAGRPAARPAPVTPVRSARPVRSLPRAA